MNFKLAIPKGNIVWQKYSLFGLYVPFLWMGSISQIKDKINGLISGV